ncbi:MAG: PDZ domain-containing protein [Candidatus Hydrogenedentes bacterium]|nr:PDZ domain-containing protein [Candidatus Hydrogenedentota bacterium]
MQFRNSRTLLLSIALLAVTAFAGAPALVAQEVPDSVRAAVDVAIAKVKPALVRIAVVWTDYRDGREQKYEATGSGTIITGEGHVVTNHHVAGHATRMFCTLSTREIIEADLIGTDAQTDIAVIKLKSDGSRIFPTATFGDSSDLRVGDYVLAMGSPMALSQSVTLGIVSNTELVIPGRMSRWGAFTLDGEDVGSLVRWIGHDADIYGGNSGGPLVNLKGEAIGVNEIRFGLSGAIPGNLAKEVAQQIIEHGEVRRAWLGLEVQPLLRTAPTTRRGVLVREAIKDTPAAAAGFQSGDVLMRLGGKEINVRFEEQIPAYNALVAALPIGQEVEAVVFRDGKEVTLKVTPTQYQKVQPKEQEFKQWGITGRDLSFVNAKEMQRDTTDGVYVSTVAAGGPAGESKPNINRGDVIVSINGKPVTNVETLRTITSEVTEGKTEPTPVMVEFERKALKYLTVVKVGIKELPDPPREVQKAWLGISTQVITREMAEQMQNPELKGHRVIQVYPGASAEKAGVQVGDLIYAVDGEPLEAATQEDYEELETLIRQYKIGSSAELGVLRGTEKIKLPIDLAAAPQQSREMKAYEDKNFEFTARDITFLDKASEKWPLDKTGVLVTKVESGGWASLGTLDVGDLIVAIDGQPVPDVATLETTMKAIESGAKSAVVFLIERGIHRAYLEFEPKWDDSASKGKE